MEMIRKLDKNMSAEPVIKNWKIIFRNWNVLK